MAIEARCILFEGRVQGVGFRMTAVHLSTDLPLAGTVRNTEQGSVELIVQGESGDIDLLVGRLREQFGAFIRNVQESRMSVGPRGAGIRVIH